MPLKEMPRDIVRAHVRVSGRVQGVAYRAFARQAALQRGLTGGVRNLDDGRVEIEVEGVRPDIDAFLMILRTGPPLARVLDVQMEWKPATGRDDDFVIWY